MSTTVSIIVPAYNAESYIGECLDSLLAQNAPNTQIICVNDGSTDGTAQILADYANNNAAICVVTQENKGLSEARNAGLSHAQGTYVMFCDADDMLREDALIRLTKHAEQTSADIVYFNADSFFESEELRESHKGYLSYYHREHQYNVPCSGTQLIASMSANGEWRPSVPLQFYRTPFLRDNQLAFIPGITHEDNAFSFCAALKATSVSYLGEAFYLRRIHGGSIMTSQKSSRNVIGYFKCFMAMMSAAAERGIRDSTILEVPYTILGAARNIYFELSTVEQKSCTDAFEGIEYVMFWNEVLRDGKAVEDALSAQGELEAIKASRSYTVARRIAGLKGKLP